MPDIAPTKPRTWVAHRAPEAPPDREERPGACGPVCVCGAGVRALLLALLLASCDCPQAVRTAEARYRACVKRCIPADMSCKPVCVEAAGPALREGCGF